MSESRNRTDRPAPARIHARRRRGRGIHHRAARGTRRAQAHRRPAIASTSRPSASVAWGGRTWRRCRARTSSPCATWTGDSSTARFADIPNQVEATAKLLKDASDDGQKARAAATAPGMEGPAGEDSEGQALHRLPRDVGQTEEHRRRGGRDARSHARADRAGRDGSGQTRVRAEAASLVGGGMPAAGATRRRDQTGRPRWATRGIPPTTRAW